MQVFLLKCLWWIFVVECASDKISDLGRPDATNGTEKFKRSTFSFSPDCGIGGCPVFTVNFGALPRSVVGQAVSGSLQFVNKMTMAKNSFKKIQRVRSAEFSHARFLAQYPGVPEKEAFSFVSVDTARSLMSTLAIGPRNIDTLDFSEADTRGTIMESQCPPAPTCSPDSKFRSLDGSCNNLNKPKMGMAQTPLRRILRNQYDDGFSLPRTQSLFGTDLPNPRTISTSTIARYVDESDKSTTMVFAFGQFVDHDLDHVPVHLGSRNEPLDCCSINTNFTTEQSMLCFPFRIPSDDPIIGRGRRCINVVRSSTAPTLECQPGPLEQVNQITHWLDASSVYGSSREVGRRLRTFSGGLLRTSSCEDGTECLPFAPEEEMCEGPTKRCGLAGDLRVNEQPTLGVMHLLFVREHNRVARQLASLNQHWDDERLYQESRRIVTAVYQHIVYNEFLPQLLGREMVQKFFQVGAGRSQYDGSIDAAISNAFAAAAYRLGHSYIPSKLRTFDVNPGVKQTGEFILHEVFGNADIIREPKRFEEFLKGLTIQASERFDNAVTSSVVNDLFSDGQFGLDLVAINIQRGRDHGLPGYVHYRKLCHLGEARNFKDLESNIRPEKILLLSSVYSNVQDIDLFVGGIMEDDCPGGGSVGCTFACLVTDVFSRLRSADRFFYDVANQAGSFNDVQLNQIQQMTMARIICDNTAMRTITPFVFRLPNSSNNPEVSCATDIQGPLDLRNF